MDKLLFVSCSEHFEPLLAEELHALGISDVRPGFRGVYIPQSMEHVFLVNYLSRLAVRVLWPLSHFTCHSADDLYKEANKINWLSFLDETKTFAIDANVTHPTIRNSLFGAQMVKDAICDQIREKKGARPSVDIKNPDLQFSLFIHNKRAVLSFDTSGAALYKRGWKEISGEATLAETLAAALLIKAGYTKDKVLCDPFCGLGTLLIEAACMATHTPAGFFRKSWGFMHHPEFNSAAWATFKEKHDSARIPLTAGMIIGADKDPTVITACRDHLRKTGFHKLIPIIHSDISRLTLPESPTLVVTDPPFGKRMESSRDLFTQLGKFLRTSCKKTPYAYVLAPTPEYIEATGLLSLARWPISHGGLDLLFFKLKNTP
jgi:putative N6-adenine-specific DNA methylase